MRDVFTTIRRSLTLIGPHAKRRIVLVGVASVFTAALDMAGLVLLVPLLTLLGAGVGATGETSDRVVAFISNLTGTTDNGRMVLILALAATLLFVLKGVTSVILLWIQAGILNKAEWDLAHDVVADYVKAPWLTQQNVTTGTLVQTAIGSAFGTTVNIIGAALAMVADGAVFVAVFIAITIIDPYLALGALTYLGLVGLLYLRVIRRTIEARGRALQDEGRVMNSSLIELVGGIKEFTIRDTYGWYSDKFLSANRGYLSAVRFINVSNASMRYGLEALLIGGAGLIIGVAVVTSTMAGAVVSIGIMLAGGIRLLPALNTLLVSVNVIRANKAAVDFIDTGLRLSEGVAPVAASQAPDRIDLGSKGAFSFEGVKFFYPERREPALTEISLNVAHGQAIGVVGATGSGKSTFVDLLLGLLEPTEGSICSGGVSITDALPFWRSQIGFVPQDIFLVDDTVEANIAFGLPLEPGSSDRLSRAVELAQLTDVLAELPDGLNTTLGERGVRLSGGQRQRIGLARALFAEPEILILDEATSALDNDTERKIGDALASLHGTLTMVVIAHRLSTVRSCDRILYLDGGRIAGIGTFDELDRTNEGFAKLVELGSLRGAF